METADCLKHSRTLSEQAKRICEEKLGLMFLGAAPLALPLSAFPRNCAFPLATPFDWKAFVRAKPLALPRDFDQKRRGGEIPAAARMNQIYQIIKYGSVILS